MILGCYQAIALKATKWPILTVFTFTYTSIYNQVKTLKIAYIIRFSAMVSSVRCCSGFPLLLFPAVPYNVKRGNRFPVSPVPAVPAVPVYLLTILCTLPKMVSLYSIRFSWQTAT